MRKQPGKSPKPRSRIAPALNRSTNRNTEAERTKHAFARKAQSLGFGVYETLGENPPYDFVLDNDQCMWTVQVKAIQSTLDLDRMDLGQLNLNRRGLGRRARCRGRNDQLSKANKVDFLAAYEVPEDTWYIIPISPKALANAELSS